MLALRNIELASFAEKIAVFFAMRRGYSIFFFDLIVHFFIGRPTAFCVNLGTKTIIVQIFATRFLVIKKFRGAMKKY